MYKKRTRRHTNNLDSKARRPRPTDIANLIPATKYIDELVEGPRAPRHETHSLHTHLAHPPRARPRRAACGPPQIRVTVTVSITSPRGARSSCHVSDVGVDVSTPATIWAVSYGGPESVVATFWLAG